MPPDQQAMTLFTVESAGPFIHSPHNARFRVCEELHFLREGASRSNTPAEEELSTPVPELRKTYLRFTVDNIGDQSSFVFGSDRQTCDVYVYASQKISRQIFAVELEDNGHKAVLKNLSTHGIGIESSMYPRQRFRGQRYLHPGDKVTISLPGFDIAVQFLKHKDENLHEIYLQQLAPKLARAMPSINQLGLDSIPESSVRSQGDNHYKLHTEIGSGEFGTVYKAMHSLTGDWVAIKVFHKPKLRPLKEAAILESLCHPNIVQFIDFISPGTGPCMLVMELLEHQNLKDAHQGCPFVMEHTRCLISELLRGLSYLHSVNVTHRDLKPANIIIVSRDPMCIKLTDFGLAIWGSDIFRSYCGSHLYLAPEVYNGPYNNKVDMWSVGVVALELANGLPDYPSGRRQYWPRLLRERLEADCSDPLFYSLVGSLLQSDARYRPSAEQGLRDRFLHVESYFLDAVGSPTEYAPTPSEYRAQYASFSGRTEDSDHLPSHPQPHGQAQAPSLIQAPPAAAPVTTYWKLKYAGATVMYRPGDGLVNISQLFKAMGYKRRVTWASLEERIGMNTIYVNGRPKAGSYVPMTDVERILLNLGLPTLPLPVLNRQIDEKS